MYDNMISVVIPCYNKEKYIKDAIDSVLYQKTKYDIEIIIIDDNSTDRSRFILKRAIDNNKKVIFIYNNDNVGAAQSRNIGIKKATGRFIAFLDADDKWTPEKVETQISLMLAKKIFISCTWYKTIDFNGKIKGIYNPTAKNIGYKDLLAECKVGTSTLVYDTNFFGKQYFPDIRKRQDFALWLKLTRQYPVKICIIKKNLTLYRIDVQNSVSANKLDCVWYRYKVLRRLEHMSFLRSNYWTFIYLIKTTLKQIKYRI